MTIVGLNNQRVRQYNKKALMTLIWQEKVVSKSQLARQTDLSIPAVSNILDELVEEGHLAHSQHTLSKRGLSSGSYQIPLTGPLTLCLNVTPTTIESQLADQQLSPLGEYAKTHVDAPHPEALLAAMLRICHQYAKTWSGNTFRLAIAIHGQVDPVTGVSQTMPQAPWKAPVEIKYLLEEKLKWPVLVDNDCVMLALAEKWQNPSRQQDFCVINVDYGIGSSFVINRQIYRGSLYGSGQIGHTIVDPDGMACTCGRYGCLETVASLTALKKQARVWFKSQPGMGDQDIDKLTTAHLLTLWRQHDPMVAQWVENGATTIGLSLYNFLNILNINQIWFYGRCCEFGERWLAAITRQISTNPFDPADPTRVNATRVAFGQLSRAQQIMGIGYLYVEKALENF
nr:ROK family transcriptional regulator [Atlantibacter sp.]